MQSLDSLDETALRAQLTFTRLMLNEPIADLSGGRGGNLRIMSREVEIVDADAGNPPPSLAANGFEAVPFSALPPGPALNPQYEDYFMKACAAAVKRQTGAALVVGMPTFVRIRRSVGLAESAPIVVSHVDFTPASALRRASELLLKHAPNRQPARFAAFNAWWLVNEGPQDRPLALCDATTIAPADLQHGHVQSRGPDSALRDYGEVAFQRYSPRARWYFYPRLGPDRLLVFCGFDSDPSRPSMVTHCSFIDPRCPLDTPPRVSVECRCLAFWFAK